MTPMPISRRRALVLASAFAGLLAAGAGLGARHLAAAEQNAVVIKDFSFAPATLTVPRGTKVVWTNRDDEPHTVTSAADPRLLKSPPLDTGESFSFTFDQPGTYKYFCSVHPHMQGTVIVQ